MKKLMPLIALALLTLPGCLTMTHSASLSPNGQIVQQTCVNGDCHKLIGAGSIRMLSKDEIYISCAKFTGSVFYDVETMRGYNCNLDRPIYR